MSSPGNACVNYSSKKRSHIVVEDAVGTFSYSTTVVSVVDTVSLPGKTITWHHKAKYRGVSSMLPIRLTGAGLPRSRRDDTTAPITGTLTITLADGSASTTYTQDVVYVDDNESDPDDP